MRFASAITRSDDVQRALDELLPPIHQRMTAGMVDLALLFASSYLEEKLETAVERLGNELPNALLIGCTAEGTIGIKTEIERTPSMSLLVASLPEVTIRPFHIRQSHVETCHAAVDWERVVAVAPESRPAFIALADPFRIDILEFLERINQAFPGAPLAGGVASAASGPGENRLIIGGEIVREGIVGVSLTGPFELKTVVSQGCRPVGRSFVITKGDRNVVRELGGRPALEQLQKMLSSLTGRDEKLAQESLFLGRVIDEYKGQFGRGDFLIHNIIGVDRNSGALGIAGPVRVGATVQFHVRDAVTADEDLHALLEPHSETGIRGAMLFGCNGRGTRMWPKPGHDAGVVHKVLGPIPLAGFFCGGEFGPIGGKNFIHGFTASLALFREPPEP
jgi:small ligand-binding sensory domain FIST